ncbi:50S ribosomal protein L21 [Patescibacteria group bacterium]|nr:50S ribosomal protein L21 [Patescibacteria group bacterium]
MFAVISVGSKQYKVSPGEVIEVDRVVGNAGDTIKIEEVLLTGDGKIKVGTPNVKGATVTAKIVSQYKGEKIHVRRFKSKVRERSSIGFRPMLTKLEIVSIEGA